MGDLETSLLTTRAQKDSQMNETPVLGNNIQSKYGSGYQPVNIQETNTSNVTIINNFNGDSSPGTTGTIMSFLLIIIGIIASIFTYIYAPEQINTSFFTDLCNDDNSGYEASCKANSAVLRISFALTIIFCLQLIGTFIITSFYDSFWGIKLLLFIGLVIGFFYSDGAIFGTEGYVWLARITGFFFVILQQVVLIDLAYTWNEQWIEYSHYSDFDLDAWCSNVWLAGIIFFSLSFFTITYISIGLMFWQFNNDCEDTMVIISFAVIFPFLATIIQLFYAERGSILTSAIMSLYSAYVCYSAITSNPFASCNPTIDSKYQTLTTVS